MLQVPRAVEDITPAWLSEALSGAFAGAVVESLRVDHALHGTATKVCLRVDYEDNSQSGPSVLWYKGGLEEHSLTPDMLIVYASEAGFYRDLASELKLNLPQAYAAYVDEASNMSYLLLEDLLGRGATFPHIAQPIAPEIARQFLTQLAVLHARYWGNPKVCNLAWLRSGGSLYQSCKVLIRRDNWERCATLPRAKFVDGPLSNFEVFQSAILGILKYDLEHPDCYVHGDSHIGNTFMTSDAVGFIDWQSTMYGAWAHDLSYFLVTALSIEDRRSSEADLLACYIADLSKLGVLLDFDEAWTAYRRHMIYPCAWAMCLPEWQAEETCCLVTEKAIVALQDLDALALVEGLWQRDSGG